MDTKRSEIAVTVNGTRYGWPSQPVVVVCIDGGDPAYLRQALACGVVPNIDRFIETGFGAVADGSMPSFTCPNNMSIITGTPTSAHGISGNYYLDTTTGEAVVMTGPELLRGETILAGFARAGARVASITAKDKLRRQLGKGLDLSRGSVCFSSERAAQCTVEENGIADVRDLVGMSQPDIYSPELSLFVLEAGIRLLERDRPDLMYLSLTDWVQHKFAPEEKEAMAFYAAIDACFGRLAELHAVVALTADHGMSDKSNEAGRPRVIWLQDILDACFGKGETTVICPITDAFLLQHGALGGFVRVWCRGKTPASAILALVRGIEGVDLALDKEAACRLFDMPPDREGDVEVVSQPGWCIGAAEADHDLSGLVGHRLRSHGGLSEAKVPFILSHALNRDYRRKAASGVLRSYRIFDYAINGTRG